jgi:hypothetical protein
MKSNSKLDEFKKELIKEVNKEVIYFSLEVNILIEVNYTFIISISGENNKNVLIFIGVA